MASQPTPFQTQDKKGRTSPWYALIKGVGLKELAPPTATQEEAQRNLSDLLKSMPTQTAAKTSAAQSPSDTPSTDSSSTPPKPKPGEPRKAGLAELSPDRLKNMREKVAFAIAAGNVSIDRLLVSIWRDKVPVLAPGTYGILAAGWELACETYFVAGIVPPWLLILLGNVQVIVSLAEASEPKPVKKGVKVDATIATGNGRSEDKQK